MSGYVPCMFEKDNSIEEILNIEEVDDEDVDVTCGEKAFSLYGCNASPSKSHSSKSPCSGVSGSMERRFHSSSNNSKQINTPYKTKNKPISNVHQSLPPMELYYNGTNYCNIGHIPLSSRCAHNLAIGCNNSTNKTSSFITTNYNAPATSLNHSKFRPCAIGIEQSKSNRWRQHKLSESEVSATAPRQHTAACDSHLYSACTTSVNAVHACDMTIPVVHYRNTSELLKEPTAIVHPSVRKQRAMLMREALLKQRINVRRKKSTFTTWGSEFANRAVTMSGSLAPVSISAIPSDSGRHKPRGTSSDYKRSLICAAASLSSAQSPSHMGPTKQRCTGPGVSNIVSDGVGSITPQEASDSSVSPLDIRSSSFYSNVTSPIRPASYCTRSPITTKCVVSQKFYY
eukprot:Tbor_TRINITY_DN2783_c0_g1::TRINITY_DN2783_c0_g1_i1::g.15226::m.15226